MKKIRRRKFINFEIRSKTKEKNKEKKIKINSHFF